MRGSSLSLATTACEVELDSGRPTHAKPSCQPSQYVSQLLGLRSGSVESFSSKVPKIPEALDSINWKWHPSSSRDADVNTIGPRLIDESEMYFHLVQFENWVQVTRDSASPVLEALELKYEGLSVILYYYLRRHLDEFGKYLGLKNVSPLSLSCPSTAYADAPKFLEKSADPFLFGAVNHACECVRKQRYTTYSIDTRFITDPIKAVLSKDNPIALIHCQLEALAVRFRNVYGGPEVIWSQDFCTQTDLLDKIYHTESDELETLAVELTATALPFFRGLSVEMIKKGSGKPLAALNRWWNSICRAAEECSATEQVLCLKLDELSMVCNYLSFPLSWLVLKNDCRNFIAPGIFTRLLRYFRAYA